MKINFRNVLISGLFFPVLMLSLLGFRPIKDEYSGELAYHQVLEWRYWEYARLEMENLVDQNSTEDRTNKCFIAYVLTIKNGHGLENCQIDSVRTPSVGEYKETINSLQTRVADLEAISMERKLAMEEAQALYGNEKTFCKKSCFFSFGNFLLLLIVLGIAFATQIKTVKTDVLSSPLR